MESGLKGNRRWSVYYSSGSCLRFVSWRLFTQWPRAPISSAQLGAIPCCVLPGPEVCIVVLPQDTNSTSWLLCSLLELAVPHSSFFAPSAFTCSLVQHDSCWSDEMGRVYTQNKTLCWRKGHIGRTRHVCAAPECYLNATCRKNLIPKWSRETCSPF